MNLSKLEKLVSRGRELMHCPRNHGGDWYRISNADDAERAELFIFGYIGDDYSDDGVTAGSFMRDLRGITAPAIDLHINSPGGLVFDGVAIYSALLNHPATVDVYVDGVAASAASFVAMAGDSRVIEKPAKMMIHDAAGLVVGNASDMLEMAALLDDLSDTIAEIYADRAGGDVAVWRDAMRAETWYSASQAVAAGLADRVNNGEPAENKTSTSATGRGSQKIHAQAWNSLDRGGKGMNIEEIMAALKAIIDNAEGRTLTDEEVKRYEALEVELAGKRTEAVKARQHAYEAPAPDNVAALVHVAPPKKDNDLERAFENYLRTGRPNQDLADLRVPAGPHMAQQVGTDSEGGFMVPEGFRQKLVEVRKAFGGIAEVVEEISTMTGQPLEWPTLNDTASVGGITPEEAPFVDGTDLAFGTVTLGAFKYTSTGVGVTTPLRVSVELLQDSAFDVQALVSRALGTRIARAQAADWAHGVGTTEPQGLLDPALTPDVVTAESTITYANLLSLEGLLDPEYEAGARWVMNKGTWTTIRGIVDGDGRPLIFDQAASGMSGAPDKTLLGYPVTLDQNIVAHTADGAAGGFAALGDLRESYVIRRVSPVVVVVNPWTRMNNGQIEYVAWERADGVIQNRLAYKVLQNVQT